MKKTIVILTLMVFVFAGHSQDRKIALGLAPVIAIPAGNFSNYNSTGIGGNLQCAISLNEKFDFYFDFGVINFPGKDVQQPGYTGKYESMQNAKTSMGCRYNINGFHGGLGIGRSTFYFTDNGETSSVSGYTLTPEIGYKVMRFDLAANFNYNFVNINSSTNNVNFFSFKLSYNIVQKKIK